MIANLVVGGLAAGCLYAMVGIAIVIVLNITDIANFAQGEMAMLTTFFAYWLMDGAGCRGGRRYRSRSCSAWCRAS